MTPTNAQIAVLLGGIREELTDPKWFKQDYIESSDLYIDLEIMVRDLDAIIEMLNNRASKP